MSRFLSEPVVYQPGLLRVTPDAIPDLKRAIDQTLKELSPHLETMRDGAMLPAPWLGDSESYETYRVYNEQVMRAPDGPFAALLAYERQLFSISQRLGEMQRTYEETEATNAEEMGRLG